AIHRADRARGRVRRRGGSIRRGWQAPMADAGEGRAATAAGLARGRAVAGAELGLPAPPFIGRWAVAVDAGWALAAAAVLGAGVWLGPRLVASAPPAAFAAALFALTLAARLALG